MISRTIITMAMTFVSGKLMENYEEQIQDIVDAVSLVIVIAIPFLHAIPFAKKIISYLLGFVIGQILQLLSVFAQASYQYFKDKKEQKIQAQLEEQAVGTYLFNVDEAIETIRNMREKSRSQIELESQLNIDILENKYVDILNDDNNVFNKLESLHIFRDTNLAENRAAVFANQKI